MRVPVPLALLVPLFFATATLTARADADPPAAQTGAAWALHLLEAGRYGEAIPAAQALVDSDPSDPLAYQIRAACAFYVGSLRAAQADSVQAATLAPRLPAARYALALCSLFGGRPDAANTELSRMKDVLPLTAPQQSDVDTARAYCLFLHGDNKEASALLLAPAGDTAPPDPVRAELSAFLAARVSPAQAATQFATFLQTPSGCPRVTEDPGIRVLFTLGARPLEPSVTEAPLQAMYAASLSEHRRGMQKAQGTAPRVAGTATLSAGWAVPRRPAMVSFFVDGQIAGMVNTAPYRLDWHSALVANGWHVVRTDALDSTGRVTASRSQTVRVDNAGASAFTASLPDPALQARVWKLLRLRPSRKCAQWTLADLLAARGDTEDAASHRAISAAIDPDFRTARAATRALFRRAGAHPLPPAASVRVASARPVGLWSGPAGAGKQVALTFDDGPNLVKTPALLDALDSAHCPATFFVVGARAEAAPELIKRMAARGDDVENHSYTHPNMAQVPPVVAEAELLRASVVIQSLSGRLPRFFRPPGGNSSPALLALARAYGQTGAFWTEDAVRFEDAGSAQALVDYVLTNLHPGSIVLLHNGSDTTIAAVPKLVEALRARGYQIVTLSQLTGGTSGAAPVQAKE